MINILSETIVSLAEAATLLPRRRAGKKAHISTLFRWTTTGCGGKKLESIQIGNTRCTSREALQRFFDALTAQADSTSTVPTSTDFGRLPSDRRKQIAAAEARLAKFGI